MQHYVKQGLTLCLNALTATCMQGSPEDVEGAMASIFVWLRYSSARHLTWQRNYNTQPRILGEAQAKLTHKIAEVSPVANLLLLTVSTPAQMPARLSAATCWSCGCLACYLHDSDMCFCKRILLSTSH